MISIITPAYNAEKYIAQTIDSVLSQTYPNWELIIVDDGSTDNTASVVKPYLKDIRVKYFYQNNGKQGKARNLAIKNSKGIYLAFLDADDLWAPEKLELQMHIMQKNNFDVVFSQGWFFNDNINTDHKDFNAPIGLQDIDIFFSSMLVQNLVPILSVLVKKKCVVDVGGFNENPKIQNAEDYQLWLRLADKKYIFYCMQERLFFYRVHPNQSTSDFSATIIPKIWVLDSVVFKSISQKDKMKIMEEKLDQILFNYIDSWSNTRINQVVNLYLKPTRCYYKYFMCKLSLCFGKLAFKRVWYRFFRKEV